jgi:chromate transporter
MAITTAWKQSEIIWLFLVCGVLAMFLRAPPKLNRTASASLWLPSFSMLTTGAYGAAALGTVGALFLFFVKAGAFVFGSGLAIVPFLYGGVVGRFHWLTERQFVDAVAVAMITPGPIVITAGFIGYLVAGVLGAVAAAFAVFAPPYFFVLIGAPYYRRCADVPQVKAFVQGVTAAAVGAIAGAAYILARRSLIDLPTVLIAVVMFAVLTWTKRIPEPLLIGAAGAIGMFLRGNIL